MSECQVIIVIVGSLTQEEERMIHYITNESAKSKYNHKKIIVVHNFMEITDRQQLKIKIEKDIKNCFDVTL